MSSEKTDKEESDPKKLEQTKNPKKSEFSLPLPPPPKPSNDNDNDNDNDDDFVYPLSSLPPLHTLFKKTIIHPAIIVPAKQTAQLRRDLKHVLMRRPKIKDVYELDSHEKETYGEEQRKLVLKLSKSGNNSSSSSSAAAAAAAEESDIYSDATLSNLLSSSSSSSDASIQKSTHALTLTYNHYTVDEILRQILPSTISEIPSAFEIIGHVAHLNLRSDTLPFKHIIGQVILDKNTPRIRLVVNKIGNIENEYRTFPMEIIAASVSEQEKKNNKKKSLPRLEVTVKEEGCNFTLDFERVYWNSRLQHEHKRLVRLIASNGKQRNKEEEWRRRNSRHAQFKQAQKQLQQQHQQQQQQQQKDHILKPIVVADVMAGVGPFAVPLTCRYESIICHANDLNPTSYKYLGLNSKNNKCNAKDLKLYNLDGRKFVRTLEKLGVEFHHVIMNLPACAIEFLDVFRGYTPPPPPTTTFASTSSTKEEEKEKEEEQLYPMIHVHCFASKGEAGPKEALQRCQDALNYKLDAEKDEVYVHVVRDVSPKKNMLCVSFRLPKGVSELEKISVGDDEEEEKKRTSGIHNDTNVMETMEEEKGDDDNIDNGKKDDNMNENEDNNMREEEEKEEIVEEQVKEPAVKKFRTE